MALFMLVDIWVQGEYSTHVVRAIRLVDTIPATWERDRRPQALVTVAMAILLEVAHVMRVRAIATGSETLEDSSSRCRIRSVNGSLIHVSSQHGHSLWKRDSSVGSSSIVGVVTERGELVVDVERGQHQGVVAGAVVVVHGRSLDVGVSVNRLAWWEVSPRTQ